MIFPCDTPILLVLDEEYLHSSIGDDSVWRGSRDELDAPLV